MSAGAASVAPGSELVAALEAAVAAVLAEPLEACTDLGLGRRLSALHRVAAQVHAALLDTVGAFDARSPGADPEDRTTRAWLSRRTRLHPSAVAATIRTARALRDHLPATRQSLAEGRITPVHAQAVAAVVDRVGPEHAATAEPILLTLAEHHDPAAVHRATGHLFALVDPEGAEKALDARYAKRGVSLGEAGGRWYLEGVLDAESAETLLAALNPMLSPADPEDRRTRRQRRADALVELARRALDTGTLPGSDAERPHVSVIVDHDHLVDGAGALTLPWTGAALPMPRARRLLCDATILPIVAKALGGVRLPLDVGRAARTATPAIHRALRVRDGGCVWPSCSAPTPWTDAHHCQHWADGGETSLANMALLCRHHHTVLHSTGARLEPDPGRPGLFRLVAPDGTSRPAQHTVDRSPPDHQLLHGR
jgi:hypothetical protein